MDHSNHTTTLLQAGGQTAISDRMRELLARAAQDHVYEQRTQGAVLDEIRQRLEGMEWLLREVRERELGGLSGTLETVSGRLDDIAAKPPMWAEGLAQHVEAVRDHVDAVGEQVGGVDTRVDAVSQRVHPILELPKLRADLGTVSESVEEALSRLQSVLEVTDGVTQRMGEVTSKLAQVSAGMEVAAGRFTRIDKSLAELHSRTERVEGVMLDLSDSLDERLALAAQQLTTTTEQVTARVDALEERLLGRLDDAEQRLGGRFDGVDGRIDRVDGRLVAIDSRLESVDVRFESTDETLAGIEGRLQSLDGRAAATDTRLDGFGTRLASVDGRLGSMNGELTGHAARFDALAQSLTGHDKRLDALTDRLHGYDGHFDTLAKQLGGHDERFDRLDSRLGEHDEHFDALAERLGGQGDRFDALAERLAAAEEHLVTRVDGLDAHLSGLTTRSEQASEALESVGETIGRLPAALAIDERIGELLDTHRDEHLERLTEAATSLTEVVRSRPDRDALAETVSGIVEPATADLNKRLGALEETMLALAEALLRPTRAKD
ncbi:hypothetical protein [Nonomuraea sp. NPDC049725]|uniref:hypothetical protein n=1 Tax=Nonomuraea sp. NPDC049725 TaxID=3154508 RepID=UPI003447E0AB